MSFLRYLSWFVRILVFVVLLLFAVKNTAPVRLHLFLGTGWDIPLIVLLLVFFSLGVAFGVAACFVRIVRQRREIAALKRGLEEAPAPPGRRAEALPAVPPELGL